MRRGDLPASGRPCLDQVATDGTRLAEEGDEVVVSIDQDALVFFDSQSGARLEAQASARRAPNGDSGIVIDGVTKRFGNFTAVDNLKITLQMVKPPACSGRRAAVRPP